MTGARLRSFTASTDLAGAIVATASGVVFFLVAYGPATLDVRNIDWLMDGDRAVNYIGWLFFRGGPWLLPPGAIPGLITPFGDSVAYSDSIPLLAFLFKPFAPLLAQPFQYFGFWLLICFALQGLFGYLLARSALPAAAGTVGALFFVTSPVLLARDSHMALCGHWLIVASLWLAFRAGPHGGGIGWRAAVTSLAAFIHPYLTVMTLALTSAPEAVPLVRGPRRLRALGHVAGLLGAALLSLGAAGFLSGPSFAAFGFGGYSADLLTFVNPMGTSAFVPAFPTLAGQYEGFSYLGLGVIALAIVALSGLRFRPSSPGPAQALMLVCVSMFVYALATPITLAGRPVISVPWYAWIKPITESLHASGRFAWPLNYLIVFSSVAGSWSVLSGEDLSRRRWALALLTGALVFNVVELRPRLVETQTGAEPVAWRRILDPAWSKVRGEYDAVLIIPPQVRGYECLPDSTAPFIYIPLAEYAGSEGLSINSGVRPRLPASLVKTACDELQARLSAGQLDGRALYIVSAEYLDRFSRWSGARFGCGRLDGLNVCIDRTRDTAFKAALLG